ncbi:ATP-binding cassette domain-containing protein [Paenibacillus sp. HW567]|uniref:ATP-binding cassette domain-containing protein n=1 Tax=Paenibacillus sp. HW567 TaxID=1034769 RepID=UPI0003772715|nr:ATP-binding cassette domain-containing protein [Paenibacillus sp. HW567]
MSQKGQGVPLNIRRLRKSFGELAVLKELDLVVDAGEFIAVVGKSGCGKSTLLRLIAGLDEPSAGTIDLDRKTDSDIRVLFQESRLLPWKRVVDNVRFGAFKRDKAKALEALRFVGLEERANDWPGILSGGQQQRVALARALAGSPRLLLLDEPLGALDALTRLEMQKLIERLWLEKQFTAVLVTHDVSEAVALADRVLLIEDGEVALDIHIALDRPRIRDAGFAHYENIILNRVMGTHEEEGYPPKRGAQYSI